MKYLCSLMLLLLFACNTSSTEKQRSADSARIDGTRLVDTLPPTDSTPANPLPGP